MSVVHITYECVQDNRALNQQVVLDKHGMRSVLTKLKLNYIWTGVRWKDVFHKAGLLGKAEGKKTHKTNPPKQPMSHQVEIGYSITMSCSHIFPPVKWVWCLESHEIFGKTSSAGWTWQELPCQTSVFCQVPSVSSPRLLSWLLGQLQGVARAA